MRATSNKLITAENQVQAPQIYVTIGNYTFGCYSNDGGKIQFPNYIESLTVTKINGQVNTYDLVFNYLITEYNDPNFFEKVFSSVQNSRRIVFNYGDSTQQDAMYRQEEGIITKVQGNFNPEGAQIVYNVSAVSVASLACSGSYSFPARFAKPSSVIYELLEQNQKYGLQDLFTGMRDITKCKANNLIVTNDQYIVLEAQTNMSVMNYINYLINNMTSGGKIFGSALKKKSFYALVYEDDADNQFGGPYFRVTEVDSEKTHPEAFEVDYGYPGKNLITNLSIDNSENYSIYYEYQQQLNPQEYVTRLNAVGEYESVYAPILSSRNAANDTKEVDRTWWTKVTDYPVKATFTLMGLLRPAVLMSYIKLNVIFFGKKHISSGLYIITKQVDKISSSGFFTTISMVRIKNDEDVV